MAHREISRTRRAGLVKIVSKIRSRRRASTTSAPPLSGGSAPARDDRDGAQADDRRRTDHGPRRHDAAQVLELLRGLTEQWLGDDPDAAHNLSSHGRMSKDRDQRDVRGSVRRTRPDDARFATPSLHNVTVHSIARQTLGRQATDPDREAGRLTTFCPFATRSRCLAGEPAAATEGRRHARGHDRPGCDWPEVGNSPTEEEAAAGKPLSPGFVIGSAAPCPHDRRGRGGTDRLDGRPRRSGCRRARPGRSRSGRRPAVSIPPRPSTANADSMTTEVGRVTSTGATAAAGHCRSSGSSLKFWFDTSSASSWAMSRPSMASHSRSSAARRSASSVAARARRDGRSSGSTHRRAAHYYFDRQDVTEFKGAELRRLRKRMQMIFLVHLDPRTPSSQSHSTSTRSASPATDRKSSGNCSDRRSEPPPLRVALPARVLGGPAAADRRGQGACPAAGPDRRRRTGSVPSMSRSRPRSSTCSNFRLTYLHRPRSERRPPHQ